MSSNLYPEVAAIVRPYTEEEHDATEFIRGNGISKESKLARVILTSFFDSRRFDEAAASSRGRQLAESGHFDRIRHAQQTFACQIALIHGADVGVAYQLAEDSFKTIEGEI